MSFLKRIDYKWVMAGLCAMTLFFALGFCSSNRGLYLTAVTEALDIQRSAFSLADSIRFVMTAVVNFYFGRLILRFGARKLLAVGFLSLVTACVLQALALGYTVVHAIAIPLETVMLPLITAGLSKGENNANLLGKIVSVNTAGYALGGPLMNKSYELLGSYIPLLSIAAGIMVAIVIVYQFIFERGTQK